MRIGLHIACVMFHQPKEIYGRKYIGLHMLVAIAYVWYICVVREQGIHVSGCMLVVSWLINVIDYNKIHIWVCFMAFSIADPCFIWGVSGWICRLGFALRGFL